MPKEFLENLFGSVDSLNRCCVQATTGGASGTAAESEERRREDLIQQEEIRLHPLVSVLRSSFFEVWRVTESVEMTAADQAASEMRTLVLEITRALVDEPDVVRLDTLNEAGSVVLRLQVAPGDLGKVIGKQGRTARSLRTILGAASMKLKHRFSLDIVEVSDTQG